MRVLLDENLPQKLRSLLTGHVVTTTAYQGWAGWANGALIEAAEAAAFEVLLTSDQNLSYQQNMKDRKLALVVLSTNKWDVLVANLPKLIAALDAAEPGSYASVQIGH
jgi:predicted nuclease of predicted toxin-antitoxin system